MAIHENRLLVAAFYKFVALPDFASLRRPLLSECRCQDVKGTILLAPEGINGTISGPASGVRSVLHFLRRDGRLVDLDHKESSAHRSPFERLKVRLKREIVTLGVPGVSPVIQVGKYVKARDWNQLLDDPSVVVVDVRNDYEVALGTFQGALNPRTKSFRDLPEWLKNEPKLKTKPKIAMFCTGGIRCEKSTAYLRAAGFAEVYHLQGGILKYLEAMPEEENRFKGECFVFDERVALGQGLRQESELCRACCAPLSDQDKHSEKYVAGYACPHCFDEKSVEKQRSLAERRKQSLKA